MLDHQRKHLFPLFTAQCSIHLRKPRRTLPPSHTKVITQSCRITQSTEECLEYVPWRPRTSFQNPLKTKQALGEASAALSTDLSVTTWTAGGEVLEEPSLPCSFGSPMLCNTDLDSTVLFLREVPGQWDCSEKRGLLPGVWWLDALLWHP